MTKSNSDLITRLMQSYLASELQSYMGNLTSAVHIIENGWLPDLDDASLTEQRTALQQHLVTNGIPADDTFLLRLGLTVPGTQRGIVPPVMVLQANRGGFPLRRQKEAAGQISRLQEALNIGHRLLPNLSSDTQQAIVELAKSNQGRSEPTDIERLVLFAQLTDEEADLLAVQAINCLDGAEKSRVCKKSCVS